MSKKYKGFKGSGYNGNKKLPSRVNSRNSRKIVAILSRAMALSQGIDAKY